ncbi:MAG: DUF885 domain-containing protein [Clostridiales Family XIII bacterium]|jgi:uncharacterized protein (DUF885 family)|nr:DUF885 domain-containing protein [Clostridiales Family XIII bacterium]
MKKPLRFLGCLILIILLTVSAAGCGGMPSGGTGGANPDGASASASLTEADTAFDAFTDELFRKYVSADTITLNFLLIHPENYGVEKPSPTFGDFGEAYFRESLAEDAESLETLQGIKRKTLSPDRQITYDILFDLLESGLDSEEYLYFDEILEPMLGFQANLPVYLAEYRFDEKGDLDEYIELLGALPEYFEKIAVFEREKKARGTFMPVKSAAAVIEQMEDFTADPEGNLLIGVFSDNLAEISDLTDEERASYEEANRKAVLEIVIPAYNTLSGVMRELNEGNTRTSGLGAIPGGKDYYSLLVKSSTGSDRSVEEIDEMLSAELDRGIAEITEIYQNTPQAYEDSLDPDYPETEPEQILKFLRGAVGADFPAVAEGSSFEIKYVDPSLEDYLSPAFFLIPPIDGTGKNAIYINKGSDQTNSELFPTLVHEGYPGHLYQFEFARGLGLAPIRYLLNMSGYEEGWATYVEIQSLRFAGLKDEESAAFADDRLYRLCLQAKADIGVHYYDWSADDVGKMLAEYGIPASSAEAVYDSVLDNPANILKYIVGCLEFTELRGRAEEALGSDFDAVSFHRALLENGAAPFSVVSDHIDRWIKEEKLQVAA